MDFIGVKKDSYNHKHFMRALVLKICKFLKIIISALHGSGPLLIV